MIYEDIEKLPLERIEDVEKLTLRWMFQATLDFGKTAHEIFAQSPDDVKEVAEDVMREILDRIPGYNVPQRIFGTVDYKRARYIILPEQMLRQALFIDSKAEKDRLSATIQMSQTSLRIRHIRGNAPIDEAGALRAVSEYGGKKYLTTTAFIHFNYDDLPPNYRLKEATLFALPNGRLQDIYNPTAQDTFFIAGRNAPTLGEDFRVRVSFPKLQAKAPWRVQRITYDDSTGHCAGTWTG